MINKIRYLFYSRKYRKIYTKENIENICNANIIHYARRNGKTFLSIRILYIRYVESYHFKESRALLKYHKKFYGYNLF